MIIEPNEIHALEQFLEYECESARLDRMGKDSHDDDRQAPVFISDHPHLLMPLGFDEFNAIDENRADESPIPSISGDWGYPIEVFFRRRESGKWLWFEGFSDYTFNNNGEKIDVGIPHAHFRDSAPIIDAPAKREPAEYWRIDGLASRLRRIAAAPDPRYYKLVFPGLWTPSAQNQNRVVLEDAVHDILQEIAAEKRELASVGWRQLEEIVAELLRVRGLKISVTKATRDGGGDIIARGELIPGEPTVLAVEVKQKAVVGLHDLQRALRANEDFPALLVATSGRFSAGVLKERQRSRNQLRLFLKDGMALGQWIKGWSAGHYRHPG